MINSTFPDKIPSNGLFSTILNFDSQTVFNQYHNQTATQNGVAQHQQNISDPIIKDLIKDLNTQIQFLSKEITYLKLRVNP